MSDPQHSVPTQFNSRQLRRCSADNCIQLKFKHSALKISDCLHGFSTMKKSTRHVLISSISQQILRIKYYNIYFTIISKNGAGGPNNCYKGNLYPLLTMRWRHPPAINDVDNINPHPGRLGTVYVLNYHVKFGMEPRKINYSINFGQFV